MERRNKTILSLVCLAGIALGVRTADADVMGGRPYLSAGFLAHTSQDGPSLHTSQDRWIHPVFPDPDIGTDSPWRFDPPDVPVIPGWSPRILPDYIGLYSVVPLSAGPIQGPPEIGTPRSALFDIGGMGGRTDARWFTRQGIDTVPSPGAATLLGLAGLLGRRRRRRRT